MSQETHRKSHLTKEQRLPQSYKEVEKILNKVKKCEANVKTVLHNSKLRGAVLHKVSGLTFNVLKQRRLLDSIIEKIQILEKEPYLRKELAGILIHEMIFGNGLPGKSKPVETILKYQDDIENAYNDLKLDDKLFSNLTSIPKYVRVNTLVMTLSEVLEDLECIGVRQIVFDANISENEFYELVKNLEKNTFLLDYHFKDLLIFHSEENLTTWSLYQKGHVFIQDKSSYIPAYALAPPPGAAVIDACAAPGMKTLHLTALMENNGVVYAFERDQQRFEILNKMLKSGHANICQTFCGDFNSVDPRDEKYSSVEYILLDPSCSGSGMVNRMDYITDTKESKNDSRIQKLAGFQIILLKHALLFPSVKRVVYSTCSITETENEFVVHEVLNHFSHRFKLSPVLPEWSIRGSNDFEFGSNCLRASPDKCFTNGFFVAMFERVEEAVDQHFQKKQHKREKKRKICDEYKINNEDTTDYHFENKNQFVKEERNSGITLNDTLKETVEEMGCKTGTAKKKHKKKHKNDKINVVNEMHTDLDSEKVANNKQNNEETMDNDFENKNQFEEEKRNKGATLINTLTKMVEEMSPKKKYKKKRKNDKMNDVNDQHSDIIIEKVANDKQNNEEIIDNDSEYKDQYVEEKINNDVTLNDTITKAVEEIPLKKKHKKKHQNEKMNDVVNNEQNNDFTSIVKKTKSHKKHKHDKEYSKSNSESNTLIAIQDLKSEKDNIENGIFVSEIQEVCLKQKKKNQKDIQTGTHTNVDNAHMPSQSSVIVDNSTELKNENNKMNQNNSCNNGLNYMESFNSEERTLLEMPLEIEISQKKRKHKKQYENQDSLDSFCEAQKSEAQVSNINDDIVAETVQKVKKKHKRKHEMEEYNNSICETQVQNSNVENNSLAETKQIENFPHKKKKNHRRKHEIEEYNNSFCETQVENSNIENNTLTETVQTEDFPHKKKKHKRKREIEKYNSFCESQRQTSNVGNNTLTETAQTEDFSHKKVKRKRKHEIGEYDSSFSVQNANTENNSLTETVKVEKLHKKKKHKRKLEIEN